MGKILSKKAKMFSGISKCLMNNHLFTGQTEIFTTNWLTKTISKILKREL